MMALTKPRLDSVNSGVIRAQREQRDRTYPDRLYRFVSQKIDRACDAVERVNLDGGTSCPAEVRTLVMQLQRLALEPVEPPRSTFQAHDELFRLSSLLLGRPEGDLEFDIEAAQQPEAER